MNLHNIKLLLNILVLSFLVILIIFYNSPCEASNELGWREYSNKYFKMKYSAEWNKVEAGKRAGFAPVNSSEYFGFDIEVVETEYVSTFERFKNRLQGQINQLHSDTSNIEVKKIYVDSQPAYKIIATNSLYRVNGVIISVYKDQTAFDLTFTGSEDEYINNIKIIDEMISSLKFNNFKVEEEEVVDTLVKGRKLTSKEALEDAEYLFEKIKEIHPNLYNYYSKQEADEYESQIKEHISNKNELTTLELYKLLAPYVASFKDGHTKLSILDEYKHYIEQEGKIFPLDVVVKGDQLFVSDDFIEKSISAGTEILSINGVSSLEILMAMKKRM